MPSNSTYPAVIHIRDFVEHIEPDPTRPGKGQSMQLRISLNIPLKDIQSEDVEHDEIPTLIRFLMRVTSLTFISQTLLSIPQDLS
jgi:hypothetical protein